MLERAGTYRQSRDRRCVSAWLTGLCTLSLLIVSALGWAQKADVLSEDEEDKLRETQDPSDRIGLYLDFIQERLVRFDDYRSRPSDPRYDIATYLEKQLDQCISLNDEMKNWIEYQFGRQADMRKGLRKLLEVVPKQLEELRHAQEATDAYAPALKSTLRDAVDDFNDTVDGATQVLSEQEKLLGRLKQEAKEDAQAAKQRAKEEKKRNKEERKLRKQQRKKAGPSVSDED